jgi:hypothetical protein
MHWLLIFTKAFIVNRWVYLILTQKRPNYHIQFPKQKTFRAKSLGYIRIWIHSNYEMNWHNDNNLYYDITGYKDEVPKNEAAKENAHR